MRKGLMILILGAATVVQGQQAGSPATTTTTTTTGGSAAANARQSFQQNQETPRGINTGNEPNGRAFNFSNRPPGRPFRIAITNDTRFTTNNTRFAPVDTNGFPATQPFNGTNQLNQSRFGTNNFSANQGSQETVNASITNTLSAMSPVQANNVIQVQAGLNALQQIAINLGGVQNVQQVIQRNPQIQDQLQKVETQINTLAQGQVRPTGDIVSRLSEDLLRVNAQAQLSQNQLLVLALVINQAVNSADMSPAQIESAINTGLANLESAGAPRSVSHLVGCDLHSIAFQLQPGMMGATAQ